jgi:hypothetical protein
MTAIKERVGWVAKDDALLAIDANKDGVINNQSELFGNTTRWQTGLRTWRSTTATRTA